MSNVASDNRDAHLARAIETGVIRVWADGYGAWHASVPVSYARPHETARYAVRLMLQERAPRDTYVDPPRMRLRETGPGHTCTKPDPCQATRYEYVETGE